MSKMKILLCIVTVFVLFSCHGGKKLARISHPESIPADVADEKYILLVQQQEEQMANHQNRLAEKQLKKYYNGRYELATKKDIETNKKYADVNVYRYALIRHSKPFTSSAYTTAGVTPGGKSHTVGYYDQHILDRKENKGLTSVGLGSFNFAQGVMYFSKVATTRFKQ